MADASSGKKGRRVRGGEITDRNLAALLAGVAFIQIRAAAGRARREPGKHPADETLAQIRYLADLCHNLPLGDGRGAFGGKPRRELSRRERAMIDRPMAYTWATIGPEGQEWVLKRVAEYGLDWTPPPPLPTPRKGTPVLSVRERLSVLTGWPARTPPGREPLPRPARALKSIDTATVERLDALGRSETVDGAAAQLWLSAHLARDAEHFIFPDPYKHHWPEPGRPTWECSLLLRMADGEQVRSMVRLLPDDFVALPSTLPRLRQRRLALTIRAFERGLHVWRLDHDPECGPRTCGFTPAG